MLLDSSPNRYVIGMDPPARALPRRHKPSQPKPAKPAETASEGASASTILLTLGVLAGAMISAILGYYLYLARQEASAERLRANTAAARSLTLSARLTNLSNDRDELFEDRRKLLRSIQDEHEKEATARHLAQQWAQAHNQAVAETYQVANKWAEHSSQLERSLGSARTQLYETTHDLKAEKETAAKTTAELDDKVQALDREASGYYNLARKLDDEAAGLRSSLSSAESSNRSLQSENSSLRSEVSCLSGKVSSLESEVSSLRCQLSHTRCQHCGR